jgi:glycosyltransferase involved in cell wall biosynthesis
MRYLTALPVYNEESHIAPVLAKVRRYAQDILVVDDGSKDATPERLAAEPGIHVVRHERNQGYGAALRTAFEYALRNGYDALVTIDCDGQHQPELIPQLVAALDSDGQEWDLVSGSRYLQQFDGDSLPPRDRRHINYIITQALNNRLGLNLTDTFCGFKAYRVEALRNIDVTELGYAMPLQFWVQAVANGVLIREFPVPLIYLDEKRSFGGSLDDARRRLAYYREVIERELAAADMPELGPLELCVGHPWQGCDGFDS